MANMAIMNQKLFLLVLYIYVTDAVQYSRADNKAKNDNAEPRPDAEPEEVVDCVGVVLQAVVRLQQRERGRQQRVQQLQQVRRGVRPARRHVAQHAAHVQHAAVRVRVVQRRQRAAQRRQQRAAARAHAPHAEPQAAARALHHAPVRHPPAPRKHRLSLSGHSTAQTSRSEHVLLHDVVEDGPGVRERGQAGVRVLRGDGGGRHVHVAEQRRQPIQPQHGVRARALPHLPVGRQ